MKTSKELGIGLISVGFMGQEHTRAYERIPVVYPELGIRTRLVHAADTSLERQEYATKVLGYERAGSDYREVLADPAVDVVSICAPNTLHAEIGVAAARAGKPFWIEKPVGRDADETARVVEAVRTAGVETSVGYNYRGVPAVERIRELVAEGTLGRITNVRSVFLNSYAADPNGALSWRFKRAHAGSGALGDLLSHVVDLVQYVVAPITSVSGVHSLIHEKRPVLPMGQATHFAKVKGGELGDVENEDYVAALVRFADANGVPGAIGNLEASRVSVGPQSRLTLEIYGTKGSAMWDFERMNEFQLFVDRGAADQGYATVLGNASQGDYGKFFPGPGLPLSYGDLKLIEAKKFLVAVTGGEKHNSNIEEALADAGVIAAIAASSESGGWRNVSVSSATPDRSVAAEQEQRRRRAREPMSGASRCDA